MIRSNLFGILSSVIVGIFTILQDTCYVWVYIKVNICKIIVSKFFKIVVQVFVTCIQYDSHFVFCICSNIIKNISDFKCFVTVTVVKHLIQFSISNFFNLITGVFANVVHYFSCRVFVCGSCIYIKIKKKFDINFFLSIITQVRDIAFCKWCCTVLFVTVCIGYARINKRSDSNVYRKIYTDFTWNSQIHITSLSKILFDCEWQKFIIGKFCQTSVLINCKINFCILYIFEWYKTIQIVFVNSGPLQNIFQIKNFKWIIVRFKSITNFYKVQKRNFISRFSQNFKFQRSFWKILLIVFKFKFVFQNALLFNLLTKVVKDCFNPRVNCLFFHLDNSSTCLNFEENISFTFNNSVAHAGNFVSTHFKPYCFGWRFYKCNCLCCIVYLQNIFVAAYKFPIQVFTSFNDLFSVFVFCNNFDLIFFIHQIFAYIDIIKFDQITWTCFCFKNSILCIAFFFKICRNNYWVLLGVILHHRCFFFKICKTYLVNFAVIHLQNTAVVVSIIYIKIVCYISSYNISISAQIIYFYRDISVTGVVWFIIKFANCYFCTCVFNVKCGDKHTVVFLSIYKEIDRNFTFFKITFEDIFLVLLQIKFYFKTIVCVDFYCKKVVLSIKICIFVITCIQSNLRLHIYKCLFCCKCHCLTTNVWIWTVSVNNKIPVSIFQNTARKVCFQSCKQNFYFSVKFLRVVKRFHNTIWQFIQKCIYTRRNICFVNSAFGCCDKLAQIFAWVNCFTFVWIYYGSVIHFKISKIFCLCISVVTNKNLMLFQIIFFCNIFCWCSAVVYVQWFFFIEWVCPINLIWNHLNTLDIKNKFWFVSCCIFEREISYRKILVKKYNRKMKIYIFFEWSNFPIWLVYVHTIFNR